jgi:hypothetical protein
MQIVHNNSRFCLLYSTIGLIPIQYSFRHSNLRLKCSTSRRNGRQEEVSAPPEGNLIRSSAWQMSVFSHLSFIYHQMQDLQRFAGSFRAIGRQAKAQKCSQSVELATATWGFTNLSEADRAAAGSSDLAFSYLCSPTLRAVCPRSFRLGPAACQRHAPKRESNPSDSPATPRSHEHSSCHFN